MSKGSDNQKKDHSFRMNPYITWIPIAFALIVAISITVFPGFFGKVLFTAQDFMVNDLGFTMVVFDIVCIALGLYWALSKYGKIKLGNLDKPRYKTLSWGGMIFTSTMAADLIYWGIFEWVYYYTDSPLGIDAANRSLSYTRDMVSAYSLFHWGPLSWIFVILPGAIYGFMIFVKKRSKENLSEACRPILGKRVDGWIGTLIDIICVIACFMCCPVWLRIGVPIMTSLMNTMFGTANNMVMQIVVLLFLWVVYTVVTVMGMRAIQIISDIGMYLYMAILAIFFIFGPMRYIIESSITSVGFVLQNYFSMSTWMDPLRLTAAAEGGMGFPQSWTVFYIANWLIVINAIPFFVAKISEGRTIRNTIIGGLIAGCLGTGSSFLIMTNFTVFQQMTGVKDYLSMVKSGFSEAQVIVEVVKTIPISSILMVTILVCMTFLFVTTLDANALMVAGFTQSHRKYGQEPNKFGRIFMAVAIYITPVAMTIANTSLDQMKAVMTITAYPMGIILIIILLGFHRDLKKIDIDHYDPKIGIDPAIFDDEFASPEIKARICSFDLVDKAEPEPDKEESDK